MKKWYSINFLSRLVFLLMTPVFFQYFAIGFIWHSIYWGVITFVLLLWSGFALLSPLIGRLGCGWFCFMGTTYDLVGKHSFHKTSWKKPKVWTRLLILVPFFLSAFTLYFIRENQGLTHGFEVIPGFLRPEFNGHYKVVWMADVSAAILLALFVDKRWACKHLCFMGAICSTGAVHSRLLPVVDTNKCTLCGKCDKECLVGIPITDYIRRDDGLITNPECILCGKCAEVCKSDSIRLRFVWNRKKYRAKWNNSSLIQ